jgi:photosystem II stability/assembly factor-like uncharacterized protein
MLKKQLFFALLLLEIVFAFKPKGGLPLQRLDQDGHADESEMKAEGESHFAPSDQFYFQRSYPDAQFDLAGYESALAMVQGSAAKVSGTSGLSDTPWTLEGPTNTGGRINAIAIDPNNSSVIFVGCSVGGIFKTTNAGTSWAPVFDAQTHLAIGDITFEPGSSQILYAGTGDPNIGGYPFLGNGIYKSTNAGTTWTNIGLDSTRTISRIIVDPADHNKIFVATMGLPMNRDHNRGLYITTNGGTTWTQSLFVADQAGIIDLVMAPGNSQILYASSWDRIRTNQESLVFGNNAKVWKTTNGGTSWTHLTNDLPAIPMSRINLAIHPTNPAILYAAYVDTSYNLYNIYKTTDAGSNWNPLDISSLDPGALAGFGWYFGNILLNPYAPNDLYLCGVQLWRTTDNGTTWEIVDQNFTVHADNHDMAFLTGGSYYLATDGGLYKTTNNGTSWLDADEIPNNQFYRIAVDPYNPGFYVGGVQDNGTNRGNAATANQWQFLLGGDGFQALFDNNPDDMVAETQNGNLWYTDDGGFGWNSFNDGINSNDRRNWDMPIIHSVHNDNVYYTGTYHVYKNSFGLAGHSWDSISNDLTDGIVFEPRFHTLTTIAESPVSATVLYAGTSDGNVQRTTNGGTSWTNISAGLPKRYVTSVKASPSNANEVFVTTSGYKNNDYLPHVFRSTNQGTTWIDISGDLPPFALNDILIHPTVANLYVVASDAGIYATQNGGQNWARVGTGMPICPVYDMEFDLVFKKLIAGTHARSMMSFPMDSLESPIFLGIAPPTDGNMTLELYPNPATEFVKVTSESTMNRWEMMDISGRQMATGEFSGTNGSFSVAHLPAGVYFLRVKCADQWMVRRFIRA